jgi:imidazoleglycerol phosphate synthase glutamine amidotransferase subunit HisH
MRATSGDLVMVPTGTANVASVRAAFRRLGVEPREAATPEDVATAARVVVPGVGDGRHRRRRDA